jgi:hypothetical protein
MPEHYCGDLFVDWANFDGGARGEGSAQGGHGVEKIGEPY